LGLAVPAPNNPQLSARFAAGRPAARPQAGNWRPLDERVQLQPSKDKRLVFAQHTTAGTLAAERGTLQWRAIVAAALSHLRRKRFPST
jgi:hypothetical protein